MDTKRLLDILLLPKQVYQKLSDKKVYLIGGIICVGIADMIFPLFEHKMMIFEGKSTGVLNYNLGIALVFMILIGFIDVMFFSLPIFDFLKVLKKDGPLFTNVNLIRLAKTYIIANLIAVPFNVLFYWIMYTDQTSKALPGAVIAIAVICYFFFMPAWFSALIARGTNLIFDIEQIKKPLVFAAIFTWNFLLAEFALPYIIEHWVMWFFK